jgi:hypothetical protein
MSLKPTADEPPSARHWRQVASDWLQRGGPSECPRAWLARWKADLPDRDAVMTEGEQKFFRLMPELFKVYSATVAPRDAPVKDYFRTCLSWSVIRFVAIEKAGLPREGEQIFTAQAHIHKNWVFAAFPMRTEVVLDPSGLMNVKVESLSMAPLERNA